MSKDLPYFRFTSFEWLNDDISLESYETKGVFIDICAYYWFKDCSITRAKLEQRFSNALAVIEALLKIGILKYKNGDDFIEISFLNKQYDQLSELRRTRQNAGSKGGKQKASKAKAKLKQKSSYKDKDKDKERYIIPPPIELVKKYCEERKNKVDANKWYSFYSAKGWMIGKNKMKDWQAAVQTWEKSETEEKFIPKITLANGKI